MNTIYIIISFVFFYLLFGGNIVENYKRIPKRSDGQTKYSQHSTLPIGVNRFPTKITTGPINNKINYNKNHYRNYHRKYRKYGNYNRRYYNYPYYYNYYNYPYLYDNIYYDLMFDPYYSQTYPVLNEYNCKTLYPCSESN